jgi:plastocyanin
MTTKGSGPAQRVAGNSRFAGGLVVALACQLLAAITANAGTLSGKVRLAGTPPPHHKIIMTADPVCDSLYPKGREDEMVVADNSGGLANVLVYVKSGLPEKYRAPAPIGVVHIDQKGCEYVPHVIGVRVGQDIEIGNEDATLHNVNTKAVLNEPFNKAMAGKGQVLNTAFQHAEVAVKLKCDIHPWMAAYVGVFANPFFAVTGADGSFTINDVPKGDKYTVEAWHETLGTQTATIAIDEKSPANLQFTFAGN